MLTNTPKMSQDDLAAPQQDAVSEKDSAQAAEISELRLAKIRQYQNDSLQQPDALQANLGAVSSDLMLLAYRLHETINRSLAGSSNRLERFAKLSRAIETYLKITRQIDRLANLDRLLSEPIS